MRLLVLGGTVFIGRHLVADALQRGHEVTVFHRGLRGDGLFPEVERILGDRMTDLDRLGGRTWDAVVDTCAYVPRAARLAVDALRGRVPHYTFISTISVYAPGVDRPTEDSALLELADPGTEEVTADTYGGLKVLCEREVHDAWGDEALILRPCIVAGPHDPTDRFTFWAHGFDQEWPMIVPDRPQPLQWIDVRDLAEWTVRLVEHRVVGTFNAAGPEQPATLQETVERVRQAVNPGAPARSASPSQLGGWGVEPWKDLPLVLPFDGGGDFMMRVDSRRALRAGLTHRPVEDTARAALEARKLDPAPLKAGISLGRLTALPA